MEKMAQIRQGAECAALHDELVMRGQPRQKMQSYDAVRRQLQWRAKQEMDENLQQLVSKLQLYKAQKKSEGARSSTVHQPNEHVPTSRNCGIAVSVDVWGRTHSIIQTRGDVILIAPSIFELYAPFREDGLRLTIVTRFSRTRYG